MACAWITRFLRSAPSAVCHSSVARRPVTITGLPRSIDFTTFWARSPHALTSNHSVLPSVHCPSALRRRGVEATRTVVHSLLSAAIRSSGVFATQPATVTYTSLLMIPPGSRPARAGLVPRGWSRSSTDVRGPLAACGSVRAVRTGLVRELSDAPVLLEDRARRGHELFVDHAPERLASLGEHRLAAPPGGPAAHDHGRGPQHEAEHEPDAAPHGGCSDSRPSEPVPRDRSHEQLPGHDGGTDEPGKECHDRHDLDRPCSLRTRGARAHPGERGVERASELGHA